MKEYILSNIHENNPGLYLCELPTGFGKTYTVVQAMKDYVKSSANKKKIIYLTTMNKNLPEKELLLAFDGDVDVYNEKVLRIRSNFDEVTEKLETLEVPEEYQTPTYFRLLELVQRYNMVKRAAKRDAEYIRDIEGRIRECERSFRGEISHELQKTFTNKSERLKAVRSNEKWKWLGTLYPAIFTDSHQILLMSVSKFMKRNSTLVEPSYEFLKSDMLDNSVIFIDEFDATKNTMQSEIIEKSLAVREEYLSLFKQILRGLNPQYLSKMLTYSYEKIGEGGQAKYTLDSILREAMDIEEKYHIYISYKTVEENINHRQNFLLKDATYHTILHDDKKYIRAMMNEDENRVDIYFENREEFYSHGEKDETYIGIFSMLREINRFLLHFRLFLYAWSRHYMDITNCNRKPEDDSMTIENAMSSILRCIGLTRRQEKLILGELCNPTVDKNKKELIPDNSFYQQGIEVFELEDSDAHHDNTNLKLVEIYDTPEKILVYLALKSIVYGISATAEMKSVIGNYDIDYLDEKLGDRFHLTPINKKKEIIKQLKRNWKEYDNGHIKIHSDVIENQPGVKEPYELLEESIGNDELSHICVGLITNRVADDYHVIRYCNVVIAITKFLQSKDIQSFLYLGMALPGKMNPEFDQDLLEQLFDTAKEYLNIKDEKTSFFILRGDNFDEDKDDLMDRLSKGEKIFIISSYQTIGAGQNLQYVAPNKEELVELVPDGGEGDKRHIYKDIDALYLGNITHLTVNTYKNEKLSDKELFEMLFQIEELKQHSELSFVEADAMITLAFRSYMGKGKWEPNILYKVRSVLLQANRYVMQAVGRMCRTFLKNKNIYIFIDRTLLEKISAGELKKHILTPEMKEIVRLREKLGTEYSSEKELMLNEAEKISSFGMWNIRQLLSRNWNEESMELWEKLRQTVLTYPTANEDIRAVNQTIKKLYITSGYKQSSYLYSQNSDFRDVVIDFSMDKIGFRNSGRVKKKAGFEEIIVYEMSEKNSNLSTAMKYPGLDKYFTENGYAKTFKDDDYMMSPVLFHNIYKGALGEVAGNFILRKELGITLVPITEPDKFEFFDFEISRDVYVDFKNWKFTYKQDRENVKKEIRRKMARIAAKRVYIINLIGDDEQYMPTSQVDECIIEIPGLIDKKGNVIKRNLRMIKEEDF